MSSGLAMQARVLLAGAYAGFLVGVSAVAVVLRGLEHFGLQPVEVTPHLPDVGENGDRRFVLSFMLDPFQHVGHILDGPACLFGDHGLPRSSRVAYRRRSRLRRVHVDRDVAWRALGYVADDELAVFDDHPVTGQNLLPALYISRPFDEYFAARPEGASELLHLGRRNRMDQDSH